MPMYTEKDIEKMRNEAANAECTAPIMFWEADADYLVKICNGVGAENAPEWVRDALTWIYRNYAAAAAIHDCRYELSDGTQVNRQEADKEFLDNALKLWAVHYGKLRWFRPAAYAGRAKINTAYLALKQFGDKAWQEAYNQNVQKEEILA